MIDLVMKSGDPMPLETQARAKRQADYCKIFSSATRILIVWALQDQQELCVSDIARWIEASLQNASQHLRLMEDKGLVISRREGSTVYYRIREQDS